jgi:hypothetical protein
MSAGLRNRIACRCHDPTDAMSERGHRHFEIHGDKQLVLDNQNIRNSGCDGVGIAISTV